MLSVAGQSPPFCPEPRLPGFTDPCTSGCGKAKGVFLPCVEGQRSIPRRLNSRHPVLCKWLPSFQGGWTLLYGAIRGSPGDGGGTGAAAVLPELKGRLGGQGVRGKRISSPDCPPQSPTGCRSPPSLVPHLHAQTLLLGLSDTSQIRPLSTITAPEQPSLLTAPRCATPPSILHSEPSS